jgi:hypothetical protein
MVDLSDLGPGKYQIARYRMVEAATTLPSGMMHRGLYLDRQQFEIRTGEVKQVDLERPNGRRISGSVVGPAGQNCCKPVIYVCSPNVQGTEPAVDLDVTVFDARNTDKEVSLRPNRSPLASMCWLHTPGNLSQLFQ